MPALLTTTSMRPKRSAARAAMLSTNVRSPTSPASASADPPRARHSSATWSSSARRRAEITTLAPRLARSRASCRPMPEEAPVTMATRPREAMSRDLPAAPAQRPLVTLEHRRHRHVGEEREAVGPFEAGELGADERAQLGERGRIVRITGDDERPAGLAERRVGQPDDRGARHLRMGGEQVLDLAGVDVVAATDEHLATPAAEVQVARAVDEAEAAGRNRAHRGHHAPAC